jgi:hypothetical protein
MAQQWKWVMRYTGLLISAFVFVTSIQADELFKEGTYTTTTAFGTELTFIFADAGKLTIMATGFPVSQATYRVKGDELELTTECGEDKKISIGKYRWKLQANKLTLTKIQDECYDRVTVLTSQSLLLVKLAQDQPARRSTATRARRSRQGTGPVMLPDSVKTVEVKAATLQCVKTTERGADEVYMLVFARRTDGATVQLRLPGNYPHSPQGHWDMNDNPDLQRNNPSGDSHIIDNKSLFTGELSGGQSWDIVVVVMEEDGGNSAEWQKAIAEAAQSSGNPYAIAAGVILEVYTSLFGAIVNDTDDYIGSYSLHVANNNGNVSLQWRPIDRIYDQHDFKNGHEYDMNGDGSNYKLWTFAEVR